MARLAPGLARAGWAALPAPVRVKLGPLIHPIAVGRRGGQLRLEVPWDAPRRTVRVVSASSVWDRVQTALALPRTSVFHNGALRFPPNANIAEFACRAGLLDALYVSGGAGDPALPEARRVGFRCILASELEEPAWLERAFPSVSIVVPAYAGRALLEPCLASILRNTPWPRLDIMVVDDGMDRASRDWLGVVSDRESTITVIRNDVNAGFARAANQGLRGTRGEFVVLLNDDTVVGPGWLSRLVAHLERDGTLGLVCPCTNEIGNSAKVPASYADLDGMERLATARAFDLAGGRSDMQTIALFCAAARRSTLESVGFLDERYEVGMFEDDDLSLAVRRAGKGLAVARDAWVHHVGQASFARLSDDDYLRIWEANRRRFEEKWQVKWTPPVTGKIVL